jgi:hypothetical protein
MAEVAGWNQPIVIDLTSDADSDSDVSGSDDPSSFVDLTAGSEDEQ